VSRLSQEQQFDGHAGFERLAACHEAEQNRGMLSPDFDTSEAHFSLTPSNDAGFRAMNR
jgi:hypothetical protein